MSTLIWIFITVVLCVLCFVLGGYNSQKIESTFAEKGLITVLNGVAYKYVKLDQYLDYVHLKNPGQDVTEETEINKLT